LSNSSKLHTELNVLLAADSDNRSSPVYSYWYWYTTLYYTTAATATSLQWLQSWHVSLTEHQSLCYFQRPVWKTKSW